MSSCFFVKGMEKTAANDMAFTAVWRRRWDSNPRTGSSPIKRFRVVLVMTTSIRLHVGPSNCPGKGRKERCL